MKDTETGKIELYSHNTTVSTVPLNTHPIKQDDDPVRYREAGICREAQILLSVTLMVILVMSFSVAVVSIGILANSIAPREVIIRDR